MPDINPTKENKRSSNPYYPDVALILILIPFISAFNYYLTYSNIRLNGFLVLTFTIDTVQGYLACWAVRIFIFRYLDKKCPYEDGALRRVIIQCITTTIIGIAVISVLTELTSWIAKGKPAPLNFYTIDLFIISIWFFVFTGIYTGLYYYNLWRKSETARAQENRIRTDGFMVTQGKTDLKITFEELDGFFVDGDYAVACQKTGRKYYLDQSLDNIEQHLPAILFFRLNRQFIVNRNVISGFKRADKGKILVTLSRPEYFPPEIPVSRTKAPAFKSWFRPE